MWTIEDPQQSMSTSVGPNYCLLNNLGSGLHVEFKESPKARIAISDRAVWKTLHTHIPGLVCHDRMPAANTVKVAGTTFMLFLGLYVAS